MRAPSPREKESNMNATQVLMELQQQAAKKMRTPLVEVNRKEVGGEPVELPKFYRVKGSRMRGTRGHCRVYLQQY